MKRREKRSSVFGYCYRKEIEDGSTIVSTEIGDYIQKAIPKPIVYCPCCKEQDKEQNKLKVDTTGSGSSYLNNSLYLCPNCGVAYLPKIHNMEDILKVEKENEEIYQKFLDEEYE